MPPVVPAILTADFAVARDMVRTLCNEQLPLHIDCIDPSWGDQTLTAADWQRLRSITDRWPDYVACHLMVDDPLVHIPHLASVADAVIIHVEDVQSLSTYVDAIHTIGAAAVLTANPDTQPLPYDMSVEGWQIMGVVPGKSGQTQLPNTPQRVAVICESGRGTIRSVDGGVTVANAPALVRAGANSLVVNSTYWKAENPRTVIASLTAIVTGGGHGISDSD